MFNIGQKVEFNMFDGQLCGRGIIVDYEKGVNQYNVEVIESDDLDEDENMVSCTEEEMKPAEFKVPITEEKIAEILTDIILDNAEGTEFENCEISTFDEELVTMDKGIIVKLEDGTYINLTIQGYNPEGRRMN